MLTMADKEGRGGLDPPFLADIICEQPLSTVPTVKQCLHQFFLYFGILQPTLEQFCLLQYILGNFCILSHLFCILLHTKAYFCIHLNTFDHFTNFHYACIYILCHTFGIILHTFVYFCVHRCRCSLISILQHTLTNVLAFFLANFGIHWQTLRLRFKSTILVQKLKPFQNSHNPCNHSWLSRDLQISDKVLLY